MHSIATSRREAFHWLAILATFATATAFGDVLAEKPQHGPLDAAALRRRHRRRGAVVEVHNSNGLLAFWLAYVMARALEASTGDFLPSKGGGGLGIGTSVTSYIFLAAIAIPVAYLTIAKPGQTPPAVVEAEVGAHPQHPHHEHHIQRGVLPSRDACECRCGRSLRTGETPLRSSWREAHGVA